MEHEPTSHFATLDGIRMHYVQQGAGPTAVLLHGFPETHRSWDLQACALSHAGFRVITPDLRGYGRTDRPRRGYGIERLGEDIAALIRTVAQDPVFLVGHDWGGAIAWHVATRFPRLLRRLIVLNCPHPVRMAKALVADPKQIARSWYMFFFQLPFAPEWWLTRDDGANLVRLFRASFRTHEPPRAIMDASRRALLEPGAARAAIAYYRASMRMALRPRGLRQMMRSYGPIQVPVTILWGEQDRALGTELLDGTDRFAPDLEIVRIPDAGHFVHQEKPDLVNARLLEVLRRPSNRRP